MKKLPFLDEYLKIYLCDRKCASHDAKMGLSLRDNVPAFKADALQNDRDHTVYPTGLRKRHSQFFAVFFVYTVISPRHPVKCALKNTQP